MDVTSFVELTDSDILVIAEVKRIVDAKAKRGSVDRDAHLNEIKDRFYKAGFRVEVKVWTTNYPELIVFETEIHERLAGEIDPDQMVHEVTKDILDLGEGGVISTDGLIK